MMEGVHLDGRVVEGIPEEIRVGPGQPRFFHEDAAAGLVDVVHFDAIAGVTAAHLEVAQGCLALGFPVLDLGKSRVMRRVGSR